ncbi:phospholipid/cholesterol/gamma-HCH transport system ATP-binding protein [Cognatiyoonia koreensis]|uniref:Phospholipid/cholesterol/gamma-HCH transport system ATP-binding protein n=1 Tax=Cognatiyoonia koreensis TaxID=364200 RepID=A0A1I0PSN7_9RHOB|nr:ATP-binding cassette domain-containing protein [Cognatiyoonia koreensis]SEW17390.1 phospholipid/cholesterol/gamma-HCH transport system ATP-binding protein [Cognatiyoonia koreensis]
MIHLRDVHKSFGGHKVLDGVTLDVAKGESLVVIGGSGAGKSVLIKCILGLVAADSGTITVDGKPKIEFAHFGMLFQGAALFDSLPVWQNVAFRHLQTGISRNQAKDIAIAKLRRVGLSADNADKYPAELSGGMQKRAGLARAIATEPSIIFFDEPTTGLDPIMAGVINRLIREIVTEMGATTITITHDMTSVHAIADKVAMLHAGKVQWTGKTSEIAASDDPHLMQFIHGSADGPISTVR